MMTGTTAAIIWLVIAVILFIIEGATLQLVCIWFACGSLIAMIASFFDAPFVLQLALFLLSSVAVLFLWRPMLKAKLTPKKTATNADAVIGQTGLVIEEIDNTLQTGRVSANGLNWTARSASGEIIAKGQKVYVNEIDGVKLIVKYITENGGGN